MKKIIALLLAMILVCTAFVACGNNNEETKVSVTRSFIAGYTKSVSMGAMATEMNGRVLMNLWSDGTLDIYVSLDAMGSLQTAKYTGTYKLGENAEFDETITFTYQYGETEADVATVTDAVILDGVFETEFHMITAMTSSALEFYETAPADVDGDVYIGFMQKEGGMGKMTYSYAVSLKEDGTFAVSIMQMAPAMGMHTWGATSGTYEVDGENITFTYDVVGEENKIVAEDFVSEGTGYSENGFSVGFNISQASVKASPAPFIKVK